MLIPSPLALWHPQRLPPSLGSGSWQGNLFLGLDSGLGLLGREGQAGLEGAAVQALPPAFPLGCFVGSELVSRAGALTGLGIGTTEAAQPCEAHLPWPP